MRLQGFKNKKILILGFGVEGKDAFGFLKKVFPKQRIAISDKKRRGQYLKCLKNYDIVIKSPGISPKELAKGLSEAKNRPIITSVTDIFFNNCKSKIIGITGTKGKSTTSSLIYHILKKAGKKVYLVGNIGKPPLKLLLSSKPEDIFVYELSSHQLLGLKKSPQIAVLLNIYREHLDYYRSFNEYINAKANITKYQSKNDYLVFNEKDPIVSEMAKKTNAKKVPFRGEFYQGDIAAAKAVCKILKIPYLKIESAVKSFKFLPHRLELVGRFKGITFYNDSLATIPEAAIMAMKSLGGGVETLILGGFERFYDFSDLAKEILNREIKTIIFFPTTGFRIWQELVKLGRKKKTILPKRFFVKDMKEAVRIAYGNTSRNKICLMSPASPSFSIFKDYKERGDLFKKYVKQLGKNGKN
ncbi:MAG: UDP-N-acetylmuramoyl-L-alanine--D-glutamate ligase [Candidatus Nealsonbacteria bacterium]|nr:UDP-N-acetylmuramoyl-L-alanine--D-glutamate ligase [Candidatus Nealsonbacteria bacterium]